MKVLTEYLWFNTKKVKEIVHITHDVQTLIDKSGVKEGLCLVNAMHITSSIFINDHESGLHSDIQVWLEKLAPHAPISQYRHNLTGEDNADAHLKRTIMGRTFLAVFHIITEIDLCAGIEGPFVLPILYQCNLGLDARTDNIIEACQRIANLCYFRKLSGMFVTDVVNNRAVEFLHAPATFAPLEVLHGIRPMRHGLKAGE